MCRRPMVRGSSPWDTIQSITEVPGSMGELLWISTAGHGGLWMGPDLLKRFRKLFPGFQGYAGLPYLEEDCDWAMAVLAFPQFFDQRHIAGAVRTVRSSKEYMAIGNTWLSSTRMGENLVAIADAYEAACATV